MSRTHFLNAFQQDLAHTIGAPISLSEPPPHVAADLSFSAFEAAQQKNCPPAELAKEWAKKLGASAVGPFVNIALPREKYGAIVREALAAGDRYGRGREGRGKRVFVEYSSPNVAKPFSVGHLRSTITGQALATIYEANGWEVIRANYLGDWGTQFGKLIYAHGEWKKTHRGPASLAVLKDLYVRFHEHAETDPELEERARKIFKELETGNREYRLLWKKFREVSIKEFDAIYKRLGVTFDLTSGEGAFADAARSAIEDCLKKKLCRLGEGGAVVADAFPDLPSFLLRKQDGSTLYLTRDLASIKWRVTKYRPDLLLYVVGSEQTLNFRQLFTLAQELGYLGKAEARHIAFGLVLKGGEKMSTRKGTGVALEELLNEAVIKARAIIKEKNPSLGEREAQKVAEIVGVGAMIYNTLRSSRAQNIEFDWNRMLDFEGASAAYLQYVYVRIRSILRKFQSYEIGSRKIGTSYEIRSHKIAFEDVSEWALARKLMWFPEVISRACREDAPHHIATYLEELARLFNGFYQKVSIKDTKDAALRVSRIALIQAVAQVIKNGLALLAIKVPERM